MARPKRTVLEYRNSFAVITACSKVQGSVGTRMLRIIGSKGSISFSPVERFDGASIEAELHLYEGNDVYPAGMHTLKFTPQKDRYAEQLLELARVIRKEQSPSYSFEHDYLVHEVSLAASGCIKWNA